MANLVLVKEFARTKYFSVRKENCLDLRRKFFHLEEISVCLVFAYSASDNLAHSRNPFDTIFRVAISAPRHVTSPMRHLATRATPFQPRKFLTRPTRHLVKKWLLGQKASLVRKSVTSPKVVVSSLFAGNKNSSNHLIIHI